MLQDPIDTKRRDRKEGFTGQLPLTIAGIVLMLILLVWMFIYNAKHR